MNYKKIIQKFKAKKNELIYKIKYFITSDVKRTKKRFKKRFGYVIDLNNPITFNEKIQWLKINDKNPLRTKCADKYEVREYVKSKISDKHLGSTILCNRICGRYKTRKHTTFPIYY